MTYFSLASRAPETSAVEPKLLTWLYSIIVNVPLVRTAYRRFVAGAMAQEVERGYGLDLGAGPGYVTVEFAQRRPEMGIVGLDLAVHMVEKAQRLSDRSGLDGRAIWPQGDGHCLPFADDTFDLVVSSFALHHWGDPICILDEIARVLAPRGRYYIADLCREVSPFQRFFAYATIPVISLSFGSYWGFGGYYESVRAGYTCDEARDLMERSDLPPGRVELASTWFVPIVTLVSNRVNS
jgi:ubiquinone/menaquinone biosynthesis C-methylase UbiE